LKPFLTIEEILESTQSN